MANIIKIKAGSGVPTTNDIVDRELAFNRSNSKLYINDSGEIVDLSGTGGGGGSAEEADRVVFTAQAGETLSKGDVIYISGISGNTPIVSKADADDSAKMPAFGLASASASINNSVEIVTFGTLENFDTSGFSVGDTVYVSTTAGGLTATKPTGESGLIQNMGHIVRSHASTGAIKIAGSGRTAATPNLNEDKVFLGNASNQSTPTALSSIGLSKFNNDLGFGGGANRLITDDGDGTVSTEANLTFDGSTNTLALTGDLNVGSGDFFVDDSAGRVGIGVSTPEEKMHIFGDAPFLKIENNTEDASGIVMEDAQDPGQNGRIVYDSGANKLYLQTHGGTGFTMDSSQNVGIGTQTPGYKLSVENELNVFSSGDTASPKKEGHLLRVTDTTNNNPDIEHFFVENDNLAYGMRWLFDGGANTFSLYRHNNNASGTEVIRFSRTSNDVYIPGNVGIGTVSPGYKLDVTGNVRFTSDLRNEARLLNSVGSAASPSYSFFSQGNAGMYRSGDGVGFSAAGSSVYDINSTRMYINTNVGIGGDTPQSKLMVVTSAETSIPSAGADSTFFTIGDVSSGTAQYGTMMGTLNNGNGYIQQQRFDGTATTYNLLLQPNGGNVGIGTASPNTLLHLYSTSNTQMRLQSNNTGAQCNIIYQNGTASYSVGINSAEQFSFYSSQLGADAGFINTDGNLYWNHHFLFNTNHKFIYAKDTNGANTRLLGLNNSNTTYIGPIDAYAGGSVIYGLSSNVLAHYFYTDGAIRMKLDGPVLDLPNTGDWSSILNNTNSGGLRFGSKDAGGTLAYQIEISNAGNYVKLNENTTVTGSLTATTTIHSNTGFTTDYGMGFYNGNTNFYFYNNTGDDVLYLRDLTNAQMLQTWGTSSTTMHKTLNVQGNITVTGTVDGRDVASDGSKLDGIESGATADQTAAQILTAIKTVDGSGSGLDADTLDGYDSSRFFRRQGSASATVGPGWMTVATNTSGRKAGEILVTDGDSGDHGFIRIHWLRSFSDSNFTVINCGGYNNRISGVRVLSQDSDNTYGEKILQVYVEANSAYEAKIFRMGDNQHYSDHTIHTPTIENTITGYSLHGNQLENLDTYGFAHEEGILAGGNMEADRMRTGVGTAAFPAYSFEADTDTGILRTAADTIGFSTGGSSRFTMNNSGVFYASNLIQAGNGGVQIWDGTHGFKTVLAKDSTYTKLLNNDGATCIHLGDTGDGTNYFNNGTHRFRSIGGSEYMRIQSGNISGVGSDLSLRRANNNDDRITIQASAHRFYVDAVERLSITSSGLQADQNIRVGNGSEGTPSHSFGNDTDTGMYRLGADDLGFTAGGSLKYGILNGLNRFYSNVVVGPNNNNSKPYIQYKDGYDTASTPSYSWYYDNGCGIGHPAGSTIAFSTGSAERARITNAGLKINGYLDANDIYVAHGGSDYSPGINFLGGSDTPGSNAYENAKLAYYDNSGTGFMRYIIGRGAGAHQFYIGGTRMLSVKSDGHIELRNDGSSQGASIQRVGGIQFTWDRDSYGTSNNHAILTSSDDLLINSFDDVTINLDSNNNDTASTFDIRQHSTTLTGGTLLFQVDQSGNARATADVVAYYSSDKRLKDNLKPISNSLEKLQKLTGYEFDWNEKQDTYEGHDVGVVAQEVEEVLPEVVATRDSGYKAVKYEKMIPLLIEAIKEQQEQINKLEEKLNG